MLCLASSEKLYLVERGVVYPQIVFTQILSGGSLCGSCVDDIVKILLYEGGDVELGARTSKHILVFAFDPLSLNSLFYTLHLFHIVHIIHICLVLFVCAHTSVEPRELHIAPQLLFRGIKRS